MNANVLVLAGIVVGVAIADQLASLHRLLRQRGRVRWDPVLLWLAALVLLTQLQVWWTLAGSPSEAVTLGAFLPVLVALIILFLLSAASLPDPAEEGGRDLVAYYRRESRYIWTLFVAAFGWLIGTQWVSRWMAGRWAVNGWLVELAILALMGSMILVRNRWWHAFGLAVLTLTGPVGWLSRSLS